MWHLKSTMKWSAVRGLMVLDRWLRMPFKRLPSTIPALSPRVLREKRSMVPMRDGVRLFTDVYRPADARRRAAPGRLPAMLIRVPYGAREPYTYMPVVARYWAERGFVCVVQDVRGRFGSEGAWEPTVNEIDDGYDTIEWVSRQEWCDGRVVMTGESYYAFTQWAAAASQHPALAAVAPGDMGVDQHALLYEGGALCLDTTAMWLCDQSGRRYINYFRLDASHLPAVEMPRAGGISAPRYEESVSRPLRDAFWDDVDHSHLIQKVQVPVLVWTGWYDVLMRGTLQAWAELERVRPGGPQHLIIGPTDHETNADFDLSVGRFPVASGPRSWDRIHAFMTEVLAQPVGSTLTGPRVRAYQVGADEWHELDEWPTSHDDAGLPLFPQRDGGLAAGPDQGSAGYRYDPAHPVDWWKGKDLWSATLGLGDRSALEERDDVLVFRGQSLAAPVDILGPVSASVTVTFDTPGTDVTAALVDVFPDGYTQLVTEGILRITPEIRGGAEHVQVTIDLGATGHRFGVGHRIGLELASSNFPRWDRNMNTGGVPALTHDPVVANVVFDLNGCQLNLPAVGAEQ